MWRNYLKAASANLRRHGSHAFITLLGLVLGMSSCIFMLLYVLDELGFDRWIAEPAEVYRYETLSRDMAGNERLVRKSALRASRDLQQYFPEIKAATRLIDYTAAIRSDNHQNFEKVWFVDAGFMEVFRLPLLQGDSSNALADKSSLLISRQMASRYFPGRSPVGQLLMMDDARAFTISGVFDVPRQSHMAPEFIVLYDENDPQYGFGYSESWSAVEGYTYLRLQPDTDLAALESRLIEFRQSYSPEFVVPEGRRFADFIQPRLINVRDIHLDAGGIGNIQQPGDKQMLVTLSLVAFLVLAIAACNFVNLSTARGLARVRELSVRKALGAARAQLVTQLLFESILMALVAFAVSLSFVELLLPWYNKMLGRQIELTYFSASSAAMMLGAVLLGVIAGLYPACRLSRLQPADMLRGGNSGWLQSALVVVQFAISAILVISMLVVLLQQSFIANADMGYSAERKLIIRNLDESLVRDKQDLIAATLNGLPGVLGATFSSAAPGDETGAGFYQAVAAPGQRSETFPLYPKAVDANFFSVYEIPLLSGRDFAGELSSDRFYWPQSGAIRTATAAAVLNSSGVATAGFAGAGDAVGKSIVMGNVQLEIIGVIPDVHFQSMRSAITPNLYIFSPEDFALLTLSYAANVDEQQLLANIAATWESLVPGIPFSFAFLDDNIRSQYAEDRLQFLLISIFAMLAVAIACIGLFALASFATQLRLREICIRKVHGALRVDVLATLLLQFSKPVVLANVLAWPFALYATTRYLQGFSYRVEPGWAVYAYVGGVTLALAWLTISFHVARAAAVRPAAVLRQQ